MRLPTKFGVSLPTTTPLPSTSSPRPRMRSSASADVSGPATSSRSFMYRTGLKKCITRNRCRNDALRPAIISVMRRPLVFEATMQSLLTTFSTFSKRARFGSTCSMIASTTRSTCDSFSRSSSTLPTETRRARSLEKNAAGRALMAFSRPDAANRFRAARFFFSASVRFGGTMSMSRTSMPALARCAAMPLPMTPAPMTAARRIGLRIMTWLLGCRCPRADKDRAPGHACASLLRPTGAAWRSFLAAFGSAGLLGGQGGLNRGALLNAREEGLQSGPADQVDAGVPGPREHVEEVSVGDGEGVAHQVRAGFERVGHEVESLGDLDASRLLRVFRAGEERAEGLVDLARDEVEPLLRVVALHRAGRGDEPGRRLQVGEVLVDDRAFGEERPVIEPQGGHVSLRVHGVEIGPVVRLVGSQVDSNELDG